MFTRTRVIMEFQITNNSIVCSSVCLGWGQRKFQNARSTEGEIHRDRWLVDFSQESEA